MTNFDDYASENKTEHNLKWPYIPNHPYKILIIEGSGLRKTNALWNFVNSQQVLIKYIYMQRICMKQNTNI